ncbi:hypothetical protein [Parapedobacter tibetensis]|nr:hypothetical protein [Parapedobacter tibetensis]
MEESAKDFEIIMGEGQFIGDRLLIEPVQTTDGIPIYNCYLEGKSISQLRQATSGEWMQLWGTLEKDTVQRIGKTIEDRIR